MLKAKAIDTKFILKTLTLDLHWRLILNSLKAQGLFIYIHLLGIGMHAR